MLIPNDDKAELEFLRYFYENASYAMGPADSEIYHMIKDNFLRDNGYLPEGYEIYEEDPDYDDPEEEVDHGDPDY